MEDLSTVTSIPLHSNPYETTASPDETMRKNRQIHLVFTLNFVRQKKWSSTLTKKTAENFDVSVIEFADEDHEKSPLYAINAKKRKNVAITSI